MEKSAIVMENFMSELRNGGFKKDNLPNNGPKLTSEFVAAQVISFNKLLESDIVEKALEE